MSNRQLNIYQLYEVTKEHNHLMELLESHPLEQEVIKEALQYSNESFTEMVTQLVAIEDEDDLMLDAIEKRIKELQTRADRYKRRKANLRASLYNALFVAGISKVDTPLATISLSVSAGSASVQIKELIPEEYWVPQDVKINKEKLLKDLRKGKHVPGAQLLQTESLRIKRK